MSATDHALLPESISRDFSNAQRCRSAQERLTGRSLTTGRRWLLDNDKNLRSAWTALQAADKLRNLDDRLTKAFASKMSVAIFSALQDTREATAKYDSGSSAGSLLCLMTVCTRIQASLDHIPGALEEVVRETSRASLQEAIEILREEADVARGAHQGTRGYGSGEAEKIINQVGHFRPPFQRRSDSLIREQLVDQLAAQDALVAEMEELNIPSYAESVSGRSTATTHATSLLANSLRRIDSPLSANTASSSSATRSRARSDNRKGKAKSEIPDGAVLFNPVDPLTQGPLIDPVLANDGLIHDRMTLITGEHVNLRDPDEVRSAIASPFRTKMST